MNKNKFFILPPFHEINAKFVLWKRGKKKTVTKKKKKVVSQDEQYHHI